MTHNNESINTLQQLLHHEASKFTIAEIRLVSSLHDWTVKVSSMKLKAVLQRYGDFVQRHIQNMKGFIEEENMSSVSTSNRVMQAFIDDTEEKLSHCADGAITDACLVGCIQGITHYKISTYGTAAAFARVLEMEKYAAVFHEAEVNEKQIDDRLSQLAEHEINPQAKAPISLEE